MEHFDDAPDDSANWGKAISSLDEVKDSSDDYESHNTDSDDDQNAFENDLHQQRFNFSLWNYGGIDPKSIPETLDGYHFGRHF